MKRMLSLISLAMLVFMLCFAVSAQGGQQQILSEMTDEELLLFLEEYEYTYIGTGQHIQFCSTCEKIRRYEFCIYENGRCTACGSIESIVQQSIPSVEENG